MDWEFSFFFRYNKNPSTKPTTGYYLEDFLKEFLELSLNDIQKQNICYMMLQNVLAFKNATRMNTKIKEIMVKSLCKKVLALEDQSVNVSVQNNYLKLAAKYMQNYGMVKQIFEIVKDFDDETVFLTF